MAENITDAPENPTGDGTPDKPSELGAEGSRLLREALAARKAAEQTIANQTKQIDKLNAQVKGFQDRDKTDQERSTEALAAANAKLAEAEQREAAASLKLLAHAIATRKGIAGWSEYLHGSDEAELEASADALIERIEAEAGERSGPRKPAPDHTLGKPRNAKPTTAEQFASVIRSQL